MRLTHSTSLEKKCGCRTLTIKIEDALKRHAEVEGKGIRVTVLNDEVSLDGKVDSWDERQAVISGAWSGPGVRLVEDNLTVGE